MSAPPPESDFNILKFIALGRLARGSSGGVQRSVDPDKNPDKHQVLAYAAAQKSDKVKAYKKHIKAIMSKGASKLTGGKRLRLISDENDYELHVLAEYIDDDPNRCLVFFVITDSNFGKHHSIAQLLKELKAGIYDMFDSATLSTSQSSGPINKNSQKFLDMLFTRYNSSKLETVTRKVEAVKEVMKENVNKALVNVEQLEEMEVKSEQMEEQARMFEKRSSNVLWLMRCRYIKITIIVGLLVAALLAYLIYYIYQKTRTTN